MTKQELIDWLRRLLRAEDLAGDLRKKLQEILDALERHEPTSIVLARLLADLIELGTGPLPKPIADFIKAYVDAFRTAINAILGTLWWRYRQARKNGLTHQEANDLVTSDVEICEWLHFCWAVETMKVEQPPTPPKAPPVPPPSTPPWPGNPPPAGQTPVPWDAADDGCCRMNNVPPTVTVVSASCYRDAAAGGWFVDATIEVTHPCGLRYGPDTKVYAVIASGASAIKLEIREPTPADIANGKSISWNKVQVSATRPRSLQIYVRAVSRCATVYDGFTRVPVR